eukprot:TRINITY_DN7246_c0_g1_i1.p1 TRINITY_DN7246_c0_g1~~TRINITY_DN7246_c0_g1_i1.p1  ORF type:complete len:405 (+),score=73.12 TRINITY_DN7246_c0_g1_i1:121-1215(+)
MSVQLDAPLELFLHTLSKDRKEAVMALERQYSEGAIKIMAHYLPKLMTVHTASAHIQTGKSTPWKSGCVTPASYRRRFSTFTDWIYEVAFIHLVFGGLYHKEARTKLELLSTESFDIKTVIDALKTAGGIFQYVGEQVSSHLTESVSKFPFPEMWGEFYAAYAKISRAECQAIMIKSILLKKAHDVSLELIAKLCMGVRKLYLEALKQLEQVDESVKKENSSLGLNTDLLSYLRLSKALYLACAYKYMGIHKYQDSQPGVAIAYMLKAKKCLESKTFKPSSDPSLKEEVSTYYSSIYQEELNFVTEVYTEFVKDNQAFYALVPDVNDIDAVLPNVPNWSLPVVYVPPEGEELNLELRASMCLVM